MHTVAILTMFLAPLLATTAAAQATSGRVSGIVRDSRGAPVEGARIEWTRAPAPFDVPSACVFLRKSMIPAVNCHDEIARLAKSLDSPPAPVGISKTDEEGRFSIELPPGTFDGTATSGDEVGVVQDAAPGGLDVAFALEKHALWGSVGSSGDEAGPADLLLVLERPRRVWRTKTDAKHGSSIGPVPAQGRYLALVRATGFAPALEWLMPGNSSHVSVDRAVRVSGVVTRKGTPHRAEVRVCDGRRVATGDNGRYSIDEVARGCLVEAVDGDLRGAGESYRTTDQTIDLELQPTTEVHVHVFDAQTRAPIGDAHLQVFPGAEKIVKGGSRWSGAFPDADVTQVSPGEFVIRHAPRAPHLMGVSATNYGYVDKNVVVGDASPVDVTFAMTRGETLRGRVLDSDGHPVSHAAVLVRKPGESLETAAETDADGRFAISGLRAGSRANCQWRSRIISNAC